MNLTEARVAKDGPFFIKVGGKNVGGEDNRALILKEPVDFTNRYEYLILTRDGIKLLSVEHLYNYLEIPFKGYRKIPLDALLAEPPSIHYSPGPKDGFSIGPGGQDKYISISVGGKTRRISLSDSPFSTTEEGKRTERRILDGATINSINAASKAALSPTA